MIRVSLVTLLAVAYLLYSEAKDVDYNNVFLFESVGRLNSGIAVGTLVIPIDLRALVDSFVMVERFAGHAQTEVRRHLNGTALQRVQGRMRDVQKAVGALRQPVERIVSAFGMIPEEVLKSDNRTKRSVFSLLGAFGSIVNLGIGIYDSAQIHKVIKSVRQTREELRDLVHVTGRMDRAILLNSENTNKLKGIVSGMIDSQKRTVKEIEAMDYLASVEDELLSMASSMGDWATSVIRLLRGELDPALVDMPLMLAEYDEMVVKAAQLGRSPVRTVRQAVFGSETSWAIQQEVLYVMIHVDFARREFDLHRLVPFPIRLGACGSCFVSIDQDGVFIASRPKENTGIIISGDELRSCAEKGKRFVCHQPMIEVPDIRQTCLGAAFAGDQLAVRRLCPIKIEKEDKIRAVRIHSDKIRTYFPNRTVCTEWCDGVRRSQVVQGVSTMMLKKACVIKCPGFIVSNDDEKFTLQADRPVIPVPVLEIAASWAEMADVDEEKWRKWRSSLQSMSDPDPRSFSELHRRLESMDGAESWSWSETLLLGLTALIAAAAVGWGCWRWGIERRFRSWFDCLRPARGDKEHTSDTEKVGQGEPPLSELQVSRITRIVEDMTQQFLSKDASAKQRAAVSGRGDGELHERWAQPGETFARM